MRRKDRETDEKRALEIADHADFSVLSLINNGMPYGVPVSPVRMDRSFYFHCALTGTKLDCIHAQPMTCLTFVSSAVPVQEKFTVQYASAIVMGPASIVEDPAEKRMALMKLCRRYSPDVPELYEREWNLFSDKTTVIRIEIQRITGKENRAQPE